VKSNLPNLVEQESHAIARKPRDTAAVLFGLKFADDIHYKLKSSQASKPGFRAPNIQGFRKPREYPHKPYIVKTEFNAKLRFKVIQSHVFWSQWKGDKALSNAI